MSNGNTSKKAALRVVKATGTPTAATLEDLTGVIKTMRVARQNGLDMTVQLHVESAAVHVTNVVNQVAQPAAVARPLPRFVNLDTNCKAVAIGAEHVAVYDSVQDLIITKDVLPGEANWKDSLKKAAGVRLFGREDWRAPTLQERFAIADHTRRDPALNTDHFAKGSGWEWTSNPLVNSDGSPSGFAWFVGLGGGHALWGGQLSRHCVRAVCAGQSLAIRL
jgi:hypothetical protein